MSSARQSIFREYHCVPQGLLHDLEHLIRMEELKL